MLRPPATALSQTSEIDWTAAPDRASDELFVDVEERSYSVIRPWRAIVVDDNPTLLRVVGRLLSSIPGVELVGEATSGRDALKAVDRLSPDLVLMDMVMPGMDGLEATRQLVARPCAPAVIIMTVNDLPQYQQAARAAGALRFLGKSDLVRLLSLTIQSLETDLDAGRDLMRD